MYTCINISKLLRIYVSALIYNIHTILNNSLIVEASYLLLYILYTFPANDTYQNIYIDTSYLYSLACQNTIL